MFLKMNADKYKYKVYNSIVKLLLPALVCCIFSCNDKKAARTVEPSFYYWKSVFKLTGFEKQRLDSLHIKTIYIKFFDVDWDDATQQPVPVAKLQTKNNNYNNSYLFVPVIFITNECIKKIDSAQVEQLVLDIHNLTQDIINANGFNSIAEFQFDCDWTESTKLIYFNFLNAVKEFLPQNIQLTVTLRLHQIKYPLMTGIPPVVRGTLMFYNMGDFNPAESDNSILNLNQAKNYVNSLKEYALALDIALPLYSWAVVFRNGKPIDILHEFDGNSVSSLPELKALNKNVFTAKTGFYFNSVYIQQNDIIKIEEILSAQLQQAAEMLSGNIKKENRTIIFFDLNEKTFNRIGRHEMEDVFNSFN